jgi:hypothetical protein
MVSCGGELGAPVARINVLSACSAAAAAVFINIRMIFYSCHRFCFRKTYTLAQRSEANDFNKLSEDINVQP